MILAYFLPEVADLADLAELRRELARCRCEESKLLPTDYFATKLSLTLRVSICKGAMADLRF